MEDIFLKEKSFYNVKDIQKILGIGRNSAYDFLQDAHKTGQPFKVIKIGTIYKIPILSFNNWMQKLSE